MSELVLLDKNNQVDPFPQYVVSSTQITASINVEELSTIMDDSEILAGNE